MMMRNCQICSNLVNAKHSVTLFTKDAVKDRIPEHLTRVIDLPVTETDNLADPAARNLQQQSLSWLDLHMKK